MLFKGKEQIIRDVIYLAESWKNLHDSSGFEGSSLKEIREFEATPTGRKIQAAEDALYSYMMALSVEDVKMLKAIMYLGRDRDYDKSLSPFEIYNDYFEYIGKGGWKSKEIGVNQMTEKMPLANYLKSGLNILEVVI
ncbi:hypothetical protein [Neobacillus sp. 19]|uniref:hypothetical protein n=1 Tax=Neobacillus sp. 19 TaxID=3394458 RepID=UPI003BF6FAF6